MRQTILLKQAVKKKLATLWTFNFRESGFFSFNPQATSDSEIAIANTTPENTIISLNNINQLARPSFDSGTIQKTRKFAFEYAKKE